VAETKGDTVIQTADRVYDARQATAFDALVYSNGTGMFVDQNTRVEVNKFTQERFTTKPNESASTPLEPSVSQSDVHVSRGAVGICASNMVSGSSMNYSTPQAGVNIRGGKVSIETNGEATTIDLLEGDVSVRGSGKSVGGQILRPGERAVIQPGAIGQSPQISISRIPPELLKVVDERVSIACNARTTVTFEAIELKAGEGLDAPFSGAAGGAAAAAGADSTMSGEDPTQEIVTKPTVPAQLPINVVISPDRLPGG